MKPRIKGRRSKPKKLPSKVGKVKKIYNTKGTLLLIGTEEEWRQFVKQRKSKFGGRVDR